MLIELAQTAALILALSLLQGHCCRQLNDHPLLAKLASGLVFGGVCVVGISLPIHLAPGVLIDGRSVVLSMAGLFGGPVVGVVSGAIAAAYRLWLGGAGLISGETVIVMSVLAGLSYRALYLRGRLPLSPLALFVFGLLIHALWMLPLSSIPGLTLADVYANLGLPYLLIMGAATMLLGFMLKDAEERFRTERALAKSEAHLQAITNAIPDILFVLDRDGRYLDIRTQNDKLLYRDKQSVIGRLAKDILPQPVATWLLSEIHAALASPQVRTLQYALETPAGKKVFEGTLQAIETRSEEAPRVILVVRDISERVRMEQELRIAAIAFESQQGMIVTDPETRILRVNKAFTRITGYRADEVIGKTPKVLSSGRNDAALYREMWARLATDKLWEGEVWNRRRSGEEYPEHLSISAVLNDANEVTHYVGSFSDISLSKANEAEIHQLAYYDHLTSLPNRLMLTNRLRRALSVSNRSHHYGALMFIDLDDFKNINDLHGHQTGDALLKEAAKRLRQVVRDSDTVARFGGDEFVILLEELSSDTSEAASAAERVAEKVLDTVSQPYLIDDQSYKSSASVGITLFNDSRQSVDVLMQSADLSMYESKRNGKNQLRFFDPVMQRTVSERLMLEADLRDALVHRQFELHYQAQCDAQGRVHGAEALARWRHPIRGLVSPGVFIPAAENCGLMPALGAQILEQACLQLGRWAQDPRRSELRLSVNLSAMQLYSSGFVNRMRELIEHSGFPPDRLVLELTESVLLGDITLAVRVMEALRATGIGFSIDDFGTGYSSLAYLQRLPLDELKIDRSFVQDLPHSPSSLAIVRTVVALAQALKLRLIAEGVEEAAQIDALVGNGCDSFQGYYFSKPLPLDAFEAHLNAMCQEQVP